MRDFFYDELIPWVNYIPVASNMRDLSGRYQWAEEHQKEAQQIAKAGNKLFDRLMSKSYMDKVYNIFFVDYLGQVLDAYTDTHETWFSAHNHYETLGFKVRQVAVCDEFHS
jgi:hypothetical protein